MMAFAGAKILISRKIQKQKYDFFSGNVLKIFLGPSIVFSLLFSHRVIEIQL